eukprot:TRINITY_DN1771_c0_g1_i1.p1 TRINITY_DN1771_c0_g1~~TRINITY_DN1771_c0_g1_i1.p1  ORF type:complete len:217 (-),score=26.53 TRINITY_DN1771_c0_g1_i1:111-761(-)
MFSELTVYLFIFLVFLLTYKLYSVVSKFFSFRFQNESTQSKYDTRSENLYTYYESNHYNQDVKKINNIKKFTRQKGFRIPKSQNCIENQQQEQQNEQQLINEPITVESVITSTTIIVNGSQVTEQESSMIQLRNKEQINKHLKKFKGSGIRRSNSFELTKEKLLMYKEKITTYKNKNKVKRKHLKSFLSKYNPLNEILKNKKQPQQSRNSLIHKNK